MNLLSNEAVPRATLLAHDYPRKRTAIVLIMNMRKNLELNRYRKAVGSGQTLQCDSMQDADGNLSFKTQINFERLTPVNI